MIRVLMSPISGRNPYARLLVDHLPANVAVEEFTWPRAFLCGYDILHVHWPERLFSSRSTPHQLVTGARLVLLLVVLRFTRRRIVLTAHEDAPHDGPQAWADRWLLRLVRERADRTVALSRAHAELLAGSGIDAAVVPHGDYRPVVTPHLRRPPLRGDPRPLLVGFGLLRPYKGFAELIRAGGEAPGVRLVIAGPPVDARYAEVLASLASRDPSVELRLGDLDEDELVQLVSEADGVVLPYRRIENSGSVLYALSSGTPVLVTSSASVRELRLEVGTDWVHLIEGTINGAQLQAFADAVANRGPAHPHLDGRDWFTVSAAQAEVYESLVAPN